MPYQEATIPLGSPFDVYYFSSFNNDDFKDLRIISNSGKIFKTNRCVLACSSHLCCEIFKEIYSSPVANSDDLIWISTDFTDDEVKILVNFFQDGFVPGRSESEVDLTFKGLFLAFGLDLDLLNVGVKQEPKFHLDDHLKQEEDEEGYDDPLEDPQYDVFEEEEEEEEEERPLKRSRSKRSGPANKKPKLVKKSTKKALVKKPTKRPPVTRQDPRLFDFPQTGTRDLGKMYQCSKCIRGFRLNADFKQHYLRHEINDKSKPFTCPRCLKFHAENMHTVGTHQTSCKSPKVRKDIFYYNCYHCKEVRRFNECMAYIRHLRSAHKDGWKINSDIECIPCGKKWTNQRFLNIHKGIEGPYHTNDCNSCGKTMSTLAEYQDHVAELHYGVFIYRCGLCGNSYFRNREDERAHRRICKHVKSLSNDPDSGFGCAHCGVEITTITILDHLKAKHMDLRLNCGMCKRSYYFQDELDHHVKAKHMKTKVKEYICVSCGKELATKYSLELHMRLVHEPKEERPLKCPKCDRRFVRKNEMEYHMKVHEDFRPDLLYQNRINCEHCGKSVYEKSYKSHYQAFHDTQLIHCDKCDKTFKSDKMQKLHYDRVHVMVKCNICNEEVSKMSQKYHRLSKHTSDEDRPFVCRVCDPPKGFISQSKYLEHNNIHSGERPYNCPYCPKTFKCSANKFKHIRECHKDIHNYRQKSHQ